MEVICIGTWWSSTKNHSYICRLDSNLRIVWITRSPVSAKKDWMPCEPQESYRLLHEPKSITEGNYISETGFFYYTCIILYLLFCDSRVLFSVVCFRRSVTYCMNPKLSPKEIISKTGFFLSYRCRFMCWWVMIQTECCFFVEQGDKGRLHHSWW
jgi:hypothetical protein